ncbi:hypothetical protein EYZ11_010641 [Aspergillus tanneri]|uniref:Uncharacterized protein n=1 Tax=Aspergillus tanneri TaxID=1220188 RepID=A0A4S3J4V7_9EURO|nr:hypothetical protein EYZ11_010641 [Aspergillus tanneri]
MEGDQAMKMRDGNEAKPTLFGAFNESTKY